MWEEIAMQAANTLGNKAFDIADDWLFGKYRSKRQLDQQKKLTDIQVDANKALANYGMGLQKELFHATGYEAQREQMERAGLNPALMYGHAGAGGTTGTPATGSAGMGQASSETERKMASIQAEGMALQNRLLNSQVRNIDADTEQKLATAEKTKGVDTDLARANIEDITQGIENKKVQRQGMLLQNNFDELRNALQQGSFNDNLKLIEYEAKRAEANVKMIYEQIHGMDIDNRLKLQNFDKLSEKIRLENEQILADIFVKSSQGKLNQEQADAIVKELGMKMMQIGINMDNVSVSKQFNDIYKYASDLSAETQKDNNLNSNITMITSTLLGIIGLSMGSKGSPKRVKGFSK
jgi:hypothetical protein